MGSNLHRKKLTVEGLRDLQLAVGRMDKLADGVVLPDDIELAQRSIYALAGVDYPPDGYVGHTEQWPDHIRVFLRVQHPDQIATVHREGKLFVTVEERGQGGVLTIDLPRSEDFVAHALQATQAMQKRVAENPDQTVPEIVFDHLPTRIVGDALHFGIPEEVAKAAIKNVIPWADDDETKRAERWDRLIEQPLLYRTSCECAYYHRRATNPEEPRPPEPNDAVDLSLTSYLTPGTVLVVEERRLRSGVLAQVMKPGGYCTLEELRRRLGLPVS